MEVEGTEAFKLRFKGDTEKKVTKAMNSPYGVVLPEQSVRLNEMNYKQFVKYMNDFYGPKGIYPDKKKRTLGQKDINMAYSTLLKQKPNFEIAFDSTDREMLRDILIKMKKLDPDYSKKEYMNTQLKKKKKRGLESVNEDAKDVARAKKITRDLEKIEGKYRKSMYDLSDRLQADPKNHKLQDELVKSYTKNVTSFMRDMIKITKRMK